jgi:isoamylase
MHGGSMRELNVLHVILSVYWEPLQFELPPPAENWQAWRRCIDAALRSPDDISTWEIRAQVGEASYLVQPRSVVLLALALDRATESTPQMD